MGKRSPRRGFLVVVAGTFAWVGIATASGDGVASSPRLTSGSLPGGQQESALPAVLTHGSNGRYKRTRSVYDLMNRRTEELRQEENSATPDPRVVKDLKSELRALADQL